MRRAVGVSGSSILHKERHTVVITDAEPTDDVDSEARERGTSSTIMNQSPSKKTKHNDQQSDMPLGLKV
jgi:hypothetical protein